MGKDNNFMIDNLFINNSSLLEVESSFFRIAKWLFENVQLQVNENIYRFLDIEFYYFSKSQFEDIYAHKDKMQLCCGRWYFHGSGIDITIGDGRNYGGILLRAISKLSSSEDEDISLNKNQIHGPWNVKVEICSHLRSVFEDRTNILRLNVKHISEDFLPMKTPPHIIKSKRINLNPVRDIQNKFCNAKYRYVVYPHLKLKDKTVIAKDMLEQYPELEVSGVNKLLGSKFL